MEFANLSEPCWRRRTSRRRHSITPPLASAIPNPATGSRSSRWVTGHRQGQSDFDANSQATDCAEALAGYLTKSHWSTVVGSIDSMTDPHNLQRSSTHRHQFMDKLSLNWLPARREAIGYSWSSLSLMPFPALRPVERALFQRFEFLTIQGNGANTGNCSRLFAGYPIFGSPSRWPTVETGRRRRTASRCG